MFNILAEVNGGITGHRVALVKGSNGRAMTFDNKDDADHKCRTLTAKMNRPNTATTFRYTAVPA